MPSTSWLTALTILYLYHYCQYISLHFWRHVVGLAHRIDCCLLLQQIAQYVCEIYISVSVPLFVTHIFNTLPVILIGFLSCRVTFHFWLLLKTKLLLPSPSICIHWAAQVKVKLIFTVTEHRSQRLKINHVGILYRLGSTFAIISVTENCNIKIIYRKF
jgi:hypothetical protein